MGGDRTPGPLLEDLRKHSLVEPFFLFLNFRRRSTGLYSPGVSEESNRTVLLGLLFFRYSFIRRRSSNFLWRGKSVGQCTVIGIHSVCLQKHPLSYSPSLLSSLPLLKLSLSLPPYYSLVSTFTSFFFFGFSLSLYLIQTFLYTRIINGSTRVLGWV